MDPALAQQQQHENDDNGVNPMLALTEEEQMEAAKMARIAELAELRANERLRLASASTNKSAGSSAEDIKPVYLSKEEREKRRKLEEDLERQHAEVARAQAARKMAPPPAVSKPKPINPAIAAVYLQPEPKKKKLTKKQQERIKFKFDWDDEDDTARGVDDIMAPYVPASQTTNPNSRSDRFLDMVDHRQKAMEVDRPSQGKHWTEKTLEEMTARDWRIVMEDFDIRTKGPTPPRPARNWKEMNLPEHVLASIKKAGFKSPTPIQMQAVPCGMLGKDLIGVAETGSGKTASFVLPFLSWLDGEGNGMRSNCAEDGPLAICMAPTRELAQQIEQDYQMLSTCAPWPVRSVAVVGGNSVETQGFLMREGVDVIVATPGRLIDCLDQRLAVLNQCRFVVLDEADRMIDLGFEVQVNRVLESLVVPKDQRTTFMFSATMPPAVELLATRFMKPNPIIIHVGEEKGSGFNPNIEQAVTVVQTDLAREKELLQLVQAYPAPIIVFCNEKATCDQVRNVLRSQSTHKAAVMHSGRSQAEREDALRGVRDGSYGILVATEVAGRGIDVDDVTLVLNYDCPVALDRYKHRIGRTGRAGKKGKAVTFFMPGRDDESAPFLAQYLIDTGHECPTELRRLMSENIVFDDDNDGNPGAASDDRPLRGGRGGRGDGDRGGRGGRGGDKGMRSITD